MHTFLTFINIPLDFVEEKIGQSLAKIGEFMEVEHLFVHFHEPSKTDYINDYKWTSDEEGIEVFIDTSVNIVEMTSFFQNESKGNVFLKAFPDFVTLSVPIYQDNVSVGLIGLVSKKNDFFTTEMDCQILILVGEMLMNIRSRQENLNTIKESKLLLESMIENSGSIIYVKDLNGRYLKANNSWSTQIGINRESVIEIGRAHV